MGGHNPSCSEAERLAVEQLAQLNEIPSPAASVGSTAPAVVPSAEQSAHVAAPVAPITAAHPRPLEDTNWHVEETITEYPEPGESSFEYEDTLDLETDERVSPRSRPVTELYNPKGVVSSFASVSAAAKKKRARQRNLEQINEGKLFGR